MIQPNDSPDNYKSQYVQSYIKEYVRKSLFTQTQLEELCVTLNKIYLREYERDDVHFLHRTKKYIYINCKYEKCNLSYKFAASEF